MRLAWPLLALLFESTIAQGVLHKLLRGRRPQGIVEMLQKGVHERARSAPLMRFEDSHVTEFIHLRIKGEAALIRSCNALGIAGSRPLDSPHSNDIPAAVKDSNNR